MNNNQYLCLDLEKREFMYRHYTLGKLLSERSITHLIDIGAYYSPIHLFFKQKTCMSTIIVVEPILDPISAMIPCENDPTRFTHFISLPITFKHYMTIKEQLPIPEAVVCIGCDSHYGPSRRMLETAFPRPFTLFIEYPSEYVHNAPFRKMNGEAAGEKLVFREQFIANTTDTYYTKRMMKVIEFS